MMKKAYDLKDLAERLKEKGLPMLEDGAGKVVDAVFEWLDESADVSPGKVDDMLKAIYPIAKEQIQKLTDKIDPSDNEPVTE